MTIAGTGYVGIGKETTFGTAVEPQHFLPVESAEANTDPQNYYPEQIRGHRGKSQGVPMGRKHELSIAQDGEPSTLGVWLLAALGAVSTVQPDDVGAPSVYEHVFTPANTLPSWTVEKYDNVMVQRVTGAKVDSLTINTEAGSEGALKVEAEFLAQTIADKETQSSPDYNDQPAFTFYQVEAQKGAQVNDNIKSFELEISNNLKDDHYTLRKSRDPQSLPEGMREVTFSAEMYFKDKAEWKAFFDGEEDSIKFTFDGSTIEGAQSEKLVIELPRILWDGYEVPMGGADDEIMASIEGTALFDETTAAEIRVTLTNTVQSY